MVKAERKKRKPHYTRVSRKLSYLLRHAADREGLLMDQDGFVSLSSLIERKDFQKWRIGQQEIEDIVNTDEKKRYTLQKDANEWKIRANQGHSMKRIRVKINKITTPLPNCVHGTYKRLLKQICNSGGLKIMGRQHIHLAKDLPESNEVISGMRKNCDLAIYVDMEKAMNDGVDFFLSANDVILTSGKDGLLSVKYFSKVIDRKTGEEVNLEELKGQLEKPSLPPSIPDSNDSWCSLS